VYQHRSVGRRFMRTSMRAALLLKLCLFIPTLALAVEVGVVAPSAQLATATGSVNLAPVPQRWLYVDFWASWCAPCKQSFPWMNELQAKFRDRGLQVVAINVDTKRADADRFLKQLPAQFTVAFDPAGEMPKRFAVKAMPSAYLIDPQGRVRMVHRGFKDADGDALMRDIDALLKKG
jgi:cytochrome c biogenesis protein CcmG, thiol:disulfide interchange protein DsbE